MLFDVIYKLVRKALPAFAYDGKLKKIFGREKQFKNIKHFEAIVNLYKDQCGSFEGKIVLELGCGNQFFTALLLIQAGAKKVILVDPKIKIAESNLETAVQQFNRLKNAQLNVKQISRQIELYNELQNIPVHYQFNIDNILSYTVFEHLTDPLNILMNGKLLMKPSGQMFHEIDFTDHTYHLFSNISFIDFIWKSRMLYHLRYSHKFFNLLSDPKCYMNRFLLSDYIRIINEAKLRIIQLRKLPEVGNAIIHSDLRDKKSRNSLDNINHMGVGILIGNDNLS